MKELGVQAAFGESLRRYLSDSNDSTEPAR